MSREERSKKCMVQKKSLIWSVIGKLSKWREKVTSHAQNLHLKLKQLAPSFESILAVWLKKPFFKNNTFLFFYIESSSFQHLIEFCETFQNFNSFSLFRQLLFSFFSIGGLIELKFCTFQTDSESFTFLSWKTKRFYS